MCLPEEYTTDPTAVSQEHGVICQFYDFENNFPDSEASSVQQFGTKCADLQIALVHVHISPYWLSTVRKLNIKSSSSDRPEHMRYIHELVIQCFSNIPWLHPFVPYHTCSHPGLSVYTY